jgi:hypothetical protein
MVELHRRAVRYWQVASDEALALLGAVARVRVNQCVRGGWDTVYTAAPADDFDT